MTTQHTPTSRILTTLAAASLGALLLGACSTQSLTERAASYGLERAIEGNEDIDIDFGSDGSGGFSISTEEGDFAINFDEDNGAVTFNTEDGQGAINFDEDGIVFDTDEGSGVVNFDEDGITYDTDEGSGVVNFDEDGISFENDEGAGYIASQQIPASWPNELGVPATVVSEETFFSELDLGTDIVTSAIFNHSADEAYAAQAVAALLDNGWTMVQQVETPEGMWASLSRGADTAQISSDGTGFTAITLTVPTPEG